MGARIVQVTIELFYGSQKLLQPISCRKISSGSIPAVGFKIRDQEPTQNRAWIQGVDQKSALKITKIEISIFLFSDLYCTPIGSVTILLSLLSSKINFRHTRCSVGDQNRGWWIRNQPRKSRKILMSGLYCAPIGLVIILLSLVIILLSSNEICFCLTIFRTDFWSIHCIFILFWRSSWSRNYISTPVIYPDYVFVYCISRRQILWMFHDAAIPIIMNTTCRFMNF